METVRFDIPIARAQSQPAQYHPLAAEISIQAAVEKSSETRNPLKAGIALLLTFSAGVVDIVGFLSVYHTFTAHMTGTTVHLGENLTEARWQDAIHALVVIASFTLGSIAGRAIIEVAARNKIRTVASLTLAIEAVLLVICIFAGGTGSRTMATVRLLLAMLAASMGLQTATLTRVGALTIHTTFVTGMLNKFAQLVSHACFESYDLIRGRNTAGMIRKRHQTVRQACFIFAIWWLYLAGAVSGTWLKSRWQLQALYVPVAILLLAIVSDQFTPLAVEEEKDQAER